MQQNHSFNVEVAKECGLLAATIFNNIGYWCDKNETNERNFYDGFYWSYNSYDAFIKQMPYASKPQIKLAIQKLVDTKYIIIGNYNESKFDKTNWYALTEKGYSMFHNCLLDGTEMSLDGTEMSDGEDKNVSSYIYNIYTNNKPNKKHTNSKPNTTRKNALCDFETERYGLLEDAVIRWLNFKKEIKDTYKSQDSVDTMARKLWKLSKGDAKLAMDIVEQSIGNNWKGLFELQTNEIRNNKTGRTGISEEFKREILTNIGAIQPNC